MKRLLLCTDLDRTLLPNGPQPESVLARDRFCMLADRPEVILVYVTGRDISLVQNAIKNFQIPLPDFIIADVGSSIYQQKSGQWQYLEAWENEIGNDWKGKSHADVLKMLQGFADLRLQEYSKQNTHKVSYYVPHYIAHAPLIEKIKSHLESQDMNTSLIWSIDEQANIGLLDVLPASAGKRHAIEFLMRLLEYDLNETVFAGDSGNDISVMVSPINSVLVANASEDVRSDAIKQAKANDQVQSLYIARGDYLDMNGNYSAGILEGVVHYMPKVEEWFEVKQ